VAGDDDQDDASCSCDMCVLTGRTFFARFDRHLNGSTHTLLLNILTLLCCSGICFL